MNEPHGNHEPKTCKLVIDTQKIKRKEYIITLKKITKSKQMMARERNKEEL